MAYTYDSANQLLTAQKGESLWHYVYDANGSLVEVLPNGSEASGAKRYTYNAAGYLTQVEAHNGAGWDVQAEMAYNGLGQRRSMDAAGVIAYYVMDTSTGLSASGNRPLTATTGSDTTSYLYGLGVIGEESNTWSYSLTDGTNTQRQLTDALGEVTYSARYTPWGDTLETYGSGNIAFGYFGGLMDTATGLLYVGDGQYYDPSTGRFLTRGSNPSSPNPYLPFDPTGALFLPLALVSLLYGKKRRKSKWDVVVIVGLLSLSAGMGVAACGGSDTPTQLPEGSTIEATIVVPAGSNQVEITVEINGTPSPPVVIETPFPPNIIVTALCEVAPTPTPTQTPLPTAPEPSNNCVGDCYDSYLTYKAVVSQLGRIPTIEEVLYMTAGTEYAPYGDNRAVRVFGQEGLARTFYAVCYIKDGIPGCQGDELYNFLSGYEPWSDRAGVNNNKKTPEERGEHLVRALNTNRDWLWDDVREINNFRVADAKGWTDGRVPDKPWQWFGPFKPNDTCRKNVKPSLVVKYENGYEFWMLTSDETIKFQSFGCK